MDIPRYVQLEGRGVLAVGGEDARGFLQGMISNDVEKVTPKRVIYAAFLTPQGKFLCDFFIGQAGDTLLFDCEAARLGDLIKRLTIYRLRSRVTFTDASDDHIVCAVPGTGASQALGLGGEPGAARALGRGFVYVDPRLAAIGARALLPKSEGVRSLEESGFSSGKVEDYERLRLELGLPDGSRDMAVEKAILLENGIDELNGVDFEKGCYVGQELTSRTKHRAVIRKRLFPVEIEGPLPEPGAPVMLGDVKAGEMRTGLDGSGLALLRLDHVKRAEESGAPLTAGAARITPLKPDWARF